MPHADLFGDSPVWSLEWQTPRLFPPFAGVRSACPLPHRSSRSKPIGVSIAGLHHAKAHPFNTHRDSNRGHLQGARAIGTAHKESGEDVQKKTRAVAQRARWAPPQPAHLNEPARLVLCELPGKHSVLSSFLSFVVLLKPPDLLALGCPSAQASMAAAAAATASEPVRCKCHWRLACGTADRCPWTSARACC